MRAGIKRLPGRGVGSWRATCCGTATAPGACVAGSMAHVFFFKYCTNCKIHFIYTPSLRSRSSSPPLPVPLPAAGRGAAFASCPFAPRRPRPASACASFRVGGNNSEEFRCSRKGEGGPNLSFLPPSTLAAPAIYSAPIMSLRNVARRVMYNCSGRSERVDVPCETDQQGGPRVR